jgi:molecular chaperone DnaK (HSP70)
MPKKTYRIPVIWQMMAFPKVRANSLEEAMEMVMAKSGLPRGADYLDDSFGIDKEGILDVAATEKVNLNKQPDHIVFK